MDPITSAALTTTLMPLVSGAAGEAGKAAWTAFTTFVRSTFGRDTAPVLAVDALEQQPQQASHATALANALLDLTHDDPAAEAWLRAWFAKASTVASTTTNTINTVSGTVHGHVIQAHSVGSVTFPSTSPSAG